LFDAFLPKYYWTEVMECLRKLLLTGFVVFFYEGSALQILVGLIISIIFFGLYSKLDPYLMPSNNTFASYVHFQVSITLALSLMIRFGDYLSSNERSELKLDVDFLSYILLFSNGSVLLIGIFMISKDFMGISDQDRDILGIDDPTSYQSTTHKTQSLTQKQTVKISSAFLSDPVQDQDKIFPESKIEPKSIEKSNSKRKKKKKKKQSSDSINMELS